MNKITFRRSKAKKYNSDGVTFTWVLLLNNKTVDKYFIWGFNINQNHCYHACYKYLHGEIKYSNPLFSLQEAKQYLVQIYNEKNYKLSFKKINKYLGNEYWILLLNNKIIKNPIYIIYPYYDNNHKIHFYKVWSGKNDKNIIGEWMNKSNNWLQLSNEIENFRNAKDFLVKYYNDFNKK